MLLSTMTLGKITSNVVNTINHPNYNGRRLLVVQPLTLPGASPEGDCIAVDNTYTGVGDTVLVNRKGNGARQVLQNSGGSVISMIVGIVDA